MGFKEIYLLGVDFTGANEHGSKYGHFYAEKELVSVSYTDQVKAAYGKAQKYADEHGIKIYNATRGGKLEIFPRIDFDSLFTYNSLGGTGDGIYTTDCGCGNWL